MNRNERLIGLLFDENVDGIAIASADGALEFNATATEILGLGADTSGPSEWTSRYGLFLPDGQTPYPTAELPLTRALGGETVRDVLVLSRTAAKPTGVWLSVSARPIEGGGALAVFRDVSAQRQLEDDLARRSAELARQSQANAELVQRLRVALDELSTPVLEVWDDVLALPVIGVVDTQRSALMTERVLAEVVAKKSKYVVVDLTGVEIVDTSTADRLIKLSRSVGMLGAECVVSGIQPAVAQTLIELGVELTGLFAQRNLKRALDYCISRSGHGRHG